MSFTKSWLFQNKFIGSHIETYTHLLLSGGKVNVPQEEYKTLCKHYAKDVLMGNPNFITEIRTNVFKFHMDIDLLETDELEIEKILEYCKTIQECVKQFISNKSAKKMMLIISMSPEQTKNKNGIDYIKYGIHLNWPYLKVNTYIASVLREGCIQYLLKKFGERHENNTWEDVIDKTVYINNGLRWIYSDKAQVCPSCKGKKKSSKKSEPEKEFICCTCENQGKIPTNRIYEPISILDGDNKILTNELSVLTKKTFSYILKCVELLSIRCYDDVPNIEITEPFPKWYKVVDIVLKTKYDKSKKKEKNPIVQDNLSETGIIKKTFSILEQITDEDKRYQVIQEFIEDFLPEEYSDAKIIEILYCGKKNSKYRSYIVRTDSKYCQNIQDEHNSNHIYFIITEDKIHQRCFCNCDVVRPSGVKCSNFIDKGKILNTKMKNLLFPESIEILKEKKEQIKYNPNKILETKPLNNLMEQFTKYF